MVRILVLLGGSNRSYRSEMLDRWSDIFTRKEPFAGLSVERRQHLLHEKSIVATLDPDGAVETLPDLLPQPEDLALAVAMIDRIIGEVEAPIAELKAMARYLCHALNQKTPKEFVENPAKRETRGARKGRKI